MLMDGRKQQSYSSVNRFSFFFPAEAQYVQEALCVRSGAPHPTVKFVQVVFLRDLQSKTMSCCPGKDCYHLGGISWIYPAPSNSHHQDNSTFGRESL